MKKTLLLIIALTAAIGLTACHKDCVCKYYRKGAEYEKKVAKGLHFSLDGQLRFNQNFTNFDRLRVGAGLDYTFWKKRLKVGAAGFYLLGDTGSYYEHRGRVQATVAYTERIGQFRIGVRARAQSTFYDERRGEHKFNPKTYFRGRLQFEYDFFSKPVKLFASTEFFLRLYKKDNYIVDNFRTMGDDLPAPVRQR